MTDPNRPGTFSASLEAARRHATVLGVALVVLGVLAILAPVAATVASTILIGVLLLAGGAVRIVHAFGERHEKGFGWLLVSSILYVCGGIAVLWAPLISMLSLTMVLGVFFVVSGVSKGIRALQLHGGEHVGWLIFDGLITVGLGILLLAGLPMTAFWALGVIVGVDLIIGGAMLLGLSGKVRAARSAG